MNQYYAYSITKGLYSFSIITVWGQSEEVRGLYRLRSDNTCVMRL